MRKPDQMSESAYQPTEEGKTDVKLDPALLEILACPKCHSELLADDAAERLVCTGCGLRYPVRDDIPVMLIDEAEQGSPAGSAGATPAG